MGSVSFENAAGVGAVVGVEVPTVVVDGPGSYPVGTIAGGLGFGGDADFFENVDPPQGTLQIIQYEPHTALVGSVVNGWVRDAFDSEAPEVSFQASFQIYPPEGQVGWPYSCVIPDPEGG